MLKAYAQQLNVVNSEVLKIANTILESNKIILDAFDNCDTKLLDNAKAMLKDIHELSLNIDNNIIKTLALFTPEAADLRLVVSFFKITNELQRASSNTKSFIKSFETYCTTIDKQTIKKYAIPLQEATIECLENVVNMIKCDASEVREYFDKVIVAENRNDELYSAFQDYIFKQDKEIEDFAKFTKILNTLRKNEKIADRTVDMAYLLLFAKMGGVLGEVEI
jgi:phosphate transport system protein